jgi:putative transcriptional regulator
MCSKLDIHGQDDQPGGNMVLRNRLKELRARQDLTQEALAEQAGVSRQTIISIKTGRYSPSVKLALPITRVLEVSLEDPFWLADGVGT